MKFNERFFIFLLITFPLIKNLHSSKTINLKGVQSSSSYIGKKGILVLKLEDIKENFYKKEEKYTFFKTFIFSKWEENYEVDCGFIKGFADSELNVFCEIGESILPGEYYIHINQQFSYLNYKINLNQEKKTNINIFDYIIPFLYSKKQFIEIKENINTYELTFSIYSYDSQPLMLSSTGNYITLDNCHKKSEELLCHIEKDKILSIMDDTSIWLKLEYFANEEYKTAFKFVDYINIKYIPNNQKINIKVNIKKLLINCTENDRVIAYETDVTNIPIISTDIYGFYLDFENSSGCEYFKSKCRLKKYVIGPMLILCRVDVKEGEFRLKLIEKEFEIEYLNINYNFIIQPTNNKEIFYISNNKKESFGFMNYFNILDFRVNESLKIIYYMKNSGEVQNIKLNDNSEEDIYCEDKKDIKTCIVNRYHFNKKENGYYYTSYKNHCGNRAILYEFSPVKVILY